MQRSQLLVPSTAGFVIKGTAVFTGRAGTIKDTIKCVFKKDLI